MRRGLTLVEMLASLAIVAMLMVTALAVTTSVARSRLTLRAGDGAGATLRRGAAALLETDLVHASHWRETTDGFALQTLVCLSARTMALQHVPSVVTYRVVETDAGRCLVRVQETSPEPPQTELVAVAVQGLTLEPGRQVRPNRYGWRPLAGGCTATLTVGGPGIPANRVRVRVPGKEPHAP